MAPDELFLKTAIENNLINGVIGTFHRPHPQKEAKLYQVRDARSFLEKAGVLP